MTAVWWTCRICGDDLHDSDHAMEHRLTTGHNDNALVTREVPPGPGSSDAGRRRARDLYAAAARSDDRNSDE